MTDFCTYCNDVHEVLNFGKDFSGKDTLICADRLSDALVKTMPKPDYGALEMEELGAGILSGRIFRKEKNYE